MPGRAAALERAALAALPVLSMLGLAGLVVLVALGFEEANPVLLASAAAALLVPLLATLLHLASSRELTAAQKRAWLRALFSRHAAWAWPSYFSAGRRSGPVPPPPRSP